MIDKITDHECSELLHALLNRRSPPSMMEWLPLATLSAEAPESFVIGFNKLSVDEQYELLENLSSPQSGALALLLLCRLAEFAAEIDDPNMRDEILVCSRTAHEKSSEMLKVLSEKCSGLKAQIECSQSRMAEGFDLAAEIEALEARLSEARKNEYEINEDLAQLHSLERELFTLEMRRRRCQAYNFEAKRAARDAISAEATSFEQERDELERSIAEKMGDRDSARRDVIALQQQSDTLQAELTSSGQRSKELTDGIARLRVEVEKSKAETGRLNQEHAEVLGRVELEERARKEAEDRIRQARSRLSELQEQAGASGRSDIESRIREVYAMLPQDEADRACR